MSILKVKENTEVKFITLSWQQQKLLKNKMQFLTSESHIHKSPNKILD